MPSLESLDLFFMEHHRPEIRHLQELRQESSGQVEGQQQKRA